MKDVSIARDQAISPESALKTEEIHAEDHTATTGEAETDTTGEETTDPTGISLIISDTKETETTVTRTETIPTIVTTTETTNAKEIIIDIQNVDIVKDLHQTLNLNLPQKATIVVTTVKINKENKKEDVLEVEFDWFEA